MFTTHSPVCVGGANRSRSPGSSNWLCSSCSVSCLWSHNSRKQEMDKEAGFRKGIIYRGLATTLDLVWYFVSLGSICSLLPGDNCETLLAPCSPRPCKNGGVCRESEDYQSFSCICPDGWQGMIIESLILFLFYIFMIYILYLSWVYTSTHFLSFFKVKHVSLTSTNV